MFYSSTLYFIVRGMKSREGSEITLSRSQSMAEAESVTPLPGTLATLANFVPLSWLLVTFISVKNNVAEVGSLAKLVFNSILFLGLSSLLPANVLIGTLLVPSVTLLFPREPGITFTVLQPVLFDH